MDFTDKIVIVTGASAGIGRAAALAFAKRKAIVVLVSRDLKKLESALAEVKKYSQDSIAISCDVSNYSRVKSMVSDVLKKFNRIDILINNAGFGKASDFVNDDVRDLHEVMDTNYFGLAYCTKEVLSSMIENKSGNIVNISSVVGKFTFPGMPGYCASKFAVTSFSEALYSQLYKKNINVHIIFPGVTKTDFFMNDSFPDNHGKAGDSPELVASVIIRAIEKNRFENFVRLRGKLVFLLSVLFPSFFRRQIRKQV